MTEPSEKKSSLHGRIMWAMVVGILLGFCARYFASDNEDRAKTVAFIAERIATPIGKVFIRMVVMVVVPLVISALILGVVEIGDPRKLGRIGLRTLGLTALFSLTAVLIGVTMTNILKPGVGLDTAKQEE